MLPDKKVIIVDDAQYIMAAEWMERLSERGYDIYKDLAQHMWDLFWGAQFLREDLTIIFTAHTEQLDGKPKMKTVGKMLNEKLTPEGLFTVVLEARKKAENGHIKYYLMSNGGEDTIAKSPMGMLPTELDNDYQLILDAWDKYESGH